MNDGLTWVRASVLAAVGLATALACSANDQDTGPVVGGTTGGASSGGATSSGASGGDLAFGVGGGNDGGLGIGGQGGFGGSNVGDACAAQDYNGQQASLDMYVMLDRSGSMGGGGPWPQVTQALLDFVNSPESAGIGIGLQFFPAAVCNPFAQPCEPGCVNRFGICDTIMDQCDANSYLPPRVPIAPLPGNAAAINTVINNTSPFGNTPTYPALQSATSATVGWAKSHPDRKVIVVLATDGTPEGCDISDINSVASVAAAAVAETPSVLTFVIGIGDVANLNTVAAAGGTGQALVVSTANAGQQFLEAMNQIRESALGCEFLIPQPQDGQNVDFNRVNFVYVPEGQNTGAPVPRVADASQCKGQPGWYYDNPSDPGLIILCPASCDVVKGTQGTVKVELGCETVIAPPR